MRRLSDIRGEEVIDLIADLIIPIAEISADKDASDIFQRKELPEGMSANQFAMKRIRTSLPVLLKTHKEDLMTIMSLLAGVSIEEYVKDLTMASLLTDFLTITSDPLLRQLFTSAQTNETNTSSGSAPVSSEAKA